MKHQSLQCVSSLQRNDFSELVIKNNSIPAMKPIFHHPSSIEMNSHPVSSFPSRESSSCWRTTSFSTLPKTSHSSSTKAKASTRPSLETTWANGKTEHLSGCSPPYIRFMIPLWLEEGIMGWIYWLKKENMIDPQHESLSQCGCLVMVYPCGLINGNKKGPCSCSHLRPDCWIMMKKKGSPAAGDGLRYLKVRLDS